MSIAELEFEQYSKLNIVSYSRQWTHTIQYIAYSGIILYGECELYGKTSSCISAAANLTLWQHQHLLLLLKENIQ